jgi:hypothetical protein
MLETNSIIKFNIDETIDEEKKEMKEIILISYLYISVELNNLLLHCVIT